MARIFAESDATELPAVVGVRHRSLYVLGDLYAHLIETERDPAASIARVRDHPRFIEVSERLGSFIQPYDAGTWRSPADALARRFYRWDAPEGGDGD